MHRQEVVAGVDPRAAEDDRLFACGTEGLVAPPQVCCGPQHRHRIGGHVARPGRSRRPARGRRGDRSAPSPPRYRSAARASRTRHRECPATMVPLSITKPGRNRPVNTAGSTRGTSAETGRPSATHFAMPPVFSYRDVVVAVSAEQVRQACRDRAGGVVVGDDADAGADAVVPIARANCASEGQGCRPAGSPRLPPGARDVLVHVEEHRAGDAQAARQASRPRRAGSRYQRLPVTLF